MIYLLVKRMQELIDSSTLLGPLGVFRWVEFRAVFAIIVSFLIVVLFARRTIRWLVKQKIGDNPTFDHKDLDRLMKQKANTPTMGGILIAASIYATTLLLADIQNFYIILALACYTWLFFVGVADDWMKLTTARRKPGSRHGLYSAEKLLLQIGLAVVLGLFIHHWGDNSVLFPVPSEKDMSHSLTLPLMKTWVFQDGKYIPSPHLIVLGTWPFVLLTIFMITYSSNAVNLTDGMDGLASGTMVIVASAFMVLCFIAGHTNGDFVLAKRLLVPYIPFSDELAIVAGAMVGSCLGFLWFNCSPAQVFMGDSGSLPLGGMLGYIAVVIRQEFLLIVIGGVFFLEALSVLLQVGYFKLTGGKRIFKCAPIHHHFHLLGWTEQQVVVRFWVISALLTAIALATIKVR
ncbi:MAG: phospho-N-acetylmuramoyl-pentapeptide-transferase [Phycisphaeraceae bacterium]